jgi:hypothetical protein
LDNNLFTGTIPDSLVSNDTMDISTNFLVEKIPSSIFDRSNLNTFVASRNCLSANFPVSICQQSSLASLILNGVGENEGYVTLEYV